MVTIGHLFHIKTPEIVLYSLIYNSVLGFSFEVMNKSEVLKRCWSKWRHLEKPISKLMHCVACRTSVAPSLSTQRWRDEVLLRNESWQLHSGKQHLCGKDLTSLNTGLGLQLYIIGSMVLDGRIYLDQGRCAERYIRMPYSQSFVHPSDQTD